MPAALLRSKAKFETKKCTINLIFELESQYFQA